eukprot:scaffold81800_cov30-Cyclotella_meneghiniana.AAC.2
MKRRIDGQERAAEMGMPVHGKRQISQTPSPSFSWHSNNYGCGDEDPILLQQRNGPIYGLFCVLIITFALESRGEQPGDATLPIIVAQVHLPHAFL